MQIYQGAYIQNVYIVTHELLVTHRKNSNSWSFGSSCARFIKFGFGKLKFKSRKETERQSRVTLNTRAQKIFIRK